MEIQNTEADSMNKRRNRKNSKEISEETQSIACKRPGAIMTKKGFAQPHRKWETAEERERRIKYLGW